MKITSRANTALKDFTAHLKNIMRFMSFKIGGLEILSQLFHQPSVIKFIKIVPNISFLCSVFLNACYSFRAHNVAILELGSL